MTSSNVRIGIVSPDAPPFLGGMGRHVGSLVEGFKKEGMTVLVYDRSRRRVAFALAKSIGFSCGLRFRLQRFVRKNGITILHLHAGPGGVLMPFLPHSVTTVITANHTYAAQAKLPGQAWKKIFAAIEMRMYERAHRVIAISEDTAASLQNDYGIPASKITVIPCGFDLAPWMNADNASRNTNSCVFVGRPDTRKGWDILEAAWPIVQRNFPSATLSVVGWNDSPRDGMNFLGRLSDTELQALIGSARLVVCPSRLEGFGLAAAESIAAGTPVVASNVSGLRAIVDDEKTGLLVSPDPESVAAGIIRMLQDDALWRTLHVGCQECRQRFDRDTEITAHTKLFGALHS
ncbi:MAG: glycosyltransferase family 4 protein [Candidatus Peribacteraceae bacterium]|nr:glycosyltransferase family 4 protein [Candidatus Peribacteraceae bacterium]